MDGKGLGKQNQKSASQGDFQRQNAFVEGRQILDAILVANEVVDSVLRSNRSAILCKLDLEKAYDHVDCSFLGFVMTK